MSKTSEIQYHQGTRLKKIIENSPLKAKEIIEKSGIPKSSLHEMYKKSELLGSRIKPILDVVGISIQEFFGPEKKERLSDTALLIEALKSENTALKELVSTLKEQVRLLRKNK